MLNKHNLEIAKLSGGVPGGGIHTPGIRVRPNETGVTNGHMLMIVSGTPDKSDDFPNIEGFVPSQDFEEFVAPPESVLKIVKNMSTKSRIPVLDHVAVEVQEGKNPRFAITDLDSHQVFTVRPMGKYPDLKRVVPDRGKKGVRIRLDLNVILPLLTQVKSFLRGGNSGEKRLVDICVYDDVSPIRIDAENDLDQVCTAVVMPVGKTGR